MRKAILSLMILSCSALAAMADSNPSFPGGEDALKAYVAQHTRYPQVAMDNGVEGIVVVGFSVMPDGSLNSLKVMKMIDPDLEKEAMRVVGSMPAWIPAEKNGTPVEAPSKVEIPFILE